MIRAVLAFVLLLAGPVWAEENTVRTYFGIANHGAPALGPEATHFPYVNPDAPKGGTFSRGLSGTFDTLHGFTLGGKPAAGVGAPATIGLLYDSLYDKSFDEPFSIYPLIAQSATMPDDRSWVRFTIHPDARFQDGHPITAEDVVFSFNVLMEKGSPVYAFYFANVATVEAVSTREVLFTFEPGTNREIPLIIAEDLPILPKHHWEGKDFAKPTMDPPLGSGPYRIDAVDPGRSITFARVEDYWAKDLLTRKGYFNFDRWTYQYYRDEGVLFQAFKTGAHWFHRERSARAWADAYDFPALRRGLVKRLEIPDHSLPPMQAYVFNTRRALFADKRVRRAIQHAFDFQWTNTHLSTGVMQRCEHYFGGPMAATGLPEGRPLEILEPYRDQLPPEVFSEPYTWPTTDGTGEIRDNLRAALRLLYDAGWEIDKRGLLVNAETGAPFVFEILLASVAFEDITLPFVRNLERLGMQVSIRTVDQAQFIARTDSFDFDMTMAIWGQSYSPGNEQREYWGTEAADRPGSRNYPGIKDPVVDALIEDLIAAETREDLYAHAQALDRVLLWGHYVIGQWYRDVEFLAVWDRFGRPETLPKTESRFTHLMWWEDPAKVAALAQRRAGLSDEALAPEEAADPLGIPAAIWIIGGVAVFIFMAGRFQAKGAAARRDGGDDTA